MFKKLLQPGMTENSLALSVLTLNELALVSPSVKFVARIYASSVFGFRVRICGEKINGLGSSLE